MVSDQSSFPRFMAVIALAGISVGLSACSTQSAPDLDRVERIHAQNPHRNFSAFEQAVFEDGVVSVAEYEEAYQMWRSCMEENGVEVYVQRDQFGLYLPSITFPIEEDTEEYEEKRREIMYNCEDGVFILIRAVYSDQVMNPESLNWEGGIISCLRDKKLVDPSFNINDYSQADSIDRLDPEVSACIDNPFGVVGAS